MTICGALPMSGRPYPYCVGQLGCGASGADSGVPGHWRGGCVDQLVCVASVADSGLPGHWRGVCGDCVCGTTSLDAFIITCLTSSGVSGLGSTPLSTALRPADWTIAPIDAMNGVPPEVEVP